MADLRLLLVILAFGSIQACPKGWVWSPTRGVCFGNDDKGKVKFEDALNKCKFRGGTLAKPTSKAEQELIASLNPKTSVWIGLHDMAKEGTFVWSDGMAFSGYNNWNKGEPNNAGGKEDCTHLRTDAKWNDLPCSHTLPFVCEVKPSCPEGWMMSSSRGVCFGALESAKKSYNDALDMCKKRGGILAQPKTEADQKLLVGNCGGTCPSMWIGLGDMAKEGTFVWNDGSAVKYSNWNKGEPNDYGKKEDCTHIRTQNNMWNDLNCATKLNYLCEISPVIPQYSSILPPPLPLACKKGWLMSARGVCFGTDDTGKDTYDGALAKCKKLGGTLAQPKTQADFDLILSRCPDKKCPWTWLGLDDKAKEGTFVFNDGTSLSGYNAWNKGEPNNHGGKEDCTHITLGNKWNDLSCSTKMAFLCEVAPPPPPPPPPPPHPVKPVAPVPSLVCPANWKLSSRGVCIGQVETGKAKFADAIAKCQKHGGTIAMPKTKADQDLIVSLCPNKNCNTYWMGLDDMTKEGTFVWRDGTPLKYSHWNKGEPNNYKGKEDCTHFRGDNTWNDLDCNRELKYFCEVTACPEGWVLSPTRGVCFGSDIKTKETYADATKMCKARGGHLAQIKSQAEQDLIVGLCPNKKCPWTWIGLDDIAKEGTFKWNDGSALDYTNWHKGEPNNAGNKEDCGHIWHKNQWNDIKCGHKMNFVCEKHLGHAWGTQPPVKPVAPPPPPPPPPKPVAPIPPLVCPPKWKKTSRGSCIGQVDAGKAKYADALAKCKEHGGTVAMPQTQADQNLIVNMCPDKKCGSTWIGLTDLKKEGTFVWNDGASVKYSHWHKGEPNNYKGKEDCTHLRGDNDWNDLDCGRELKYFCEVTACPEGWVLSPSRGVCFGNDITTKETYDDAAKMCKTRGGRLAQIKSQAEQDVIVGLCPDKKCPWTWIGLDDIKKEGTFVWNDGTALDYKNWHTGEPNNAANKEDCGHLWHKNQWNDINCGRKLNFMCEKQMK